MIFRGNSLLAHAKRALWKRLLRRMHFHCTLSSGLRLSIESYQDWCVVCEIFLRGEYDAPILRCLNNATGETIRVIDAGANVGFFCLRLIDTFLRRPLPRRLELIAIEPSRESLKTLRDRLSEVPPSRVTLNFREGLVGKRDGGAVLFSGKEANAHSLFSPRGSMAPNQGWIPFVDLDSCFPGNAPVDLIKCDIEGAEFDFIRSFPGLLRRTRELVIEFHEAHGDRVFAEKTLLESGFSVSEPEPSGSSGGQVVRAFSRIEKDPDIVDRLRKP